MKSKLESRRFFIQFLFNQHIRQLNQPSVSEEPPAKKIKVEEPAPKKEPPIVYQLVAEALSVKPEDIREFELSICDTQPAVIGGAFKEFIFSPRLDNLMMSFCGLMVKTNISFPTFSFIFAFSTINFFLLFDGTHFQQTTSSFLRFSFPTFRFFFFYLHFNNQLFPFQTHFLLLLFQHKKNMFPQSSPSLVFSFPISRITSFSFLFRMM